MRIISHGDTNPGKKRANNEDAFLLRSGQGLFAVADGVGGHEGGEVASKIAMDTLREALPDMLGSKDRTPPAEIGNGADRIPTAFKYVITLANRNILAAAARSSALAGMGTTITALLLANHRAVVAHVGDSRAYRLRDNTLRQLTDDHSAVAEQVRAGVLTPAQAKTSAHRHVITRALGLEDNVTPDLSNHDVKPGDVYLLCTDGLTEMVDNDAIGKVLASQQPKAAVKTLIDAANKAGGVDNITAVVVKVVEI